MSSLTPAFLATGLGEIVKSWISLGANLPISAEQAQRAPGSERIKSLSSQLGASPGQASGQLAEFLPQIIDTLMPDASVPEGGDLMARGMELLKRKLFG